MKVCLVTNIPVPYREKMHSILYEKFNKDYSVIYCAEKESNRKWSFNYGIYKKYFLSTINIYKGVHNNFNIFKILNRVNPDVVITTGFYPTMVYSFFWTLIKRNTHIVFTDGTYNSEKNLSNMHRLLRKLFFLRTKSFICVSIGGYNLYKSYNIEKDKIFRSYLCVNNERFLPESKEVKIYDLMFSGQLIEGKMPLFFVEVAYIIKKKLGACRVLILGDGNLKSLVLEKLKYYDIDYVYPGFVGQSELPSYYKQSKLFLFPTQNDTWGVVVNEAVASGVPVITCENAGVSGDLVIHKENGYIIPLIAEDWANAAIKLLQDDELYSIFSKKALEKIKQYNSENAAQAFYDAVYFSLH